MTVTASFITPLMLMLILYHKVFSIIKSRKESNSESMTATNESNGVKTNTAKTLVVRIKDSKKYNDRVVHSIKGNGGRLSLRSSQIQTYPRKALLTTLLILGIKLFTESLIHI